MGIPISRWSPKHLEKAFRRARALLDGVGTPEEIGVKQDTLAVHVRKHLTPEEYARLSPAWCALPAVDEA